MPPVMRPGTLTVLRSSIGGATSERSREEALKNINEVVHRIVQELIDDGKPLREGPEDHGCGRRGIPGGTPHCGYR